jgi:DNA-binding transcriptional ArsR family regulator
MLDNITAAGNLPSMSLESPESQNDLPRARRREPGRPGSRVEPPGAGGRREPGGPGSREAGEVGGHFEPGRPGQRFRMLDDPVAIRALAHPLRVELMSIVGRAGKITTADAARELGVSHGLASHHLRQLAKYGFVWQTAGKDNRERPWQLTHTSMSFRDAITTAEGTASASVYEQVLAERAVVNLRRWQQRRERWPAAWREHAGIGRCTVYLTLAEWTELEQAFDSLLRRYIDERPLDDISARQGSVPVDMTVIAVPLTAEPAGAHDEAASGEGQESDA